MNIIHIVTNKVWGGGERYALDMCNALRARGHNVEVFTRPVHAVYSPFREAGLLKGAFPMRGLGAVIAPISLSSELNRLEGPIVIHVHNFKDAALALNARRLASDPSRIKVVATRHLVKPAKTAPSRVKIYNELDAIIFVSQLALDTFMSTAPAVDASRLHVVRNGVAMPPEESERGSSPVNILYTGRIAAEKGVNYLIEALGRLTGLDWRLTVCGTGRGREVMPLVRATRSLGIDSRVSWEGHVTDVTPFLRRADIVVLPSVVPESFGLSAAEAMSQGCAVVTTDNGAQKEFITDGETGLLVPPAHVDALAGALTKLISDEHLRRSIGSRAAEYFRNNLDYPGFIDKIERIIKA